MKIIKIGPPLPHQCQLPWIHPNTGVSSVDADETFPYSEVDCTVGSIIECECGKQYILSNKVTTVKRLLSRNTWSSYAWLPYPQDHKNNDNKKRLIQL